MTVADILDYRAWKPALVTGLGVLVVLGVTFGAGYWQGTKRNQTKVTQAETQANIAKGEADAFKRQAEAKDQAIAAKDAAIVDARKLVSRANAEIERIKNLPAVVPSGSGTPDLRPLVERQGQLIAAYEISEKAKDGLIRDLDAKVFDLSTSRDLWKASADAREREAAGLRIALETQKTLTRNALWKGRIQGLVIGVGSFYLAKRM